MNRYCVHGHDKDEPLPDGTAGRYERNGSCRRCGREASREQNIRTRGPKRKGVNKRVVEDARRERERRDACSECGADLKPGPVRRQAYSNKQTCGERCKKRRQRRLQAPRGGRSDQTTCSNRCRQARFRRLHAPVQVPS